MLFSTKVFILAHNTTQKTPTSQKLDEILPLKSDDEETDVLMNPDVFRNVANENDETSVPTNPVLPLAMNGHAATKGPVNDESRV